MSRYAADNSNLCIAALAGAGEFRQWCHYPKNDARDNRHRTEFYYHAHSADRRECDEHGHFHVFVRTRHGQDFHHLIAISMNVHGMPTHLFLTNRWVTGERWVGADVIEPLARQFVCHVSGRLAPVARWVTSMVGVYLDDIVKLHHQRERWYRQAAKGLKTGEEVLESKRYQVVARTKIHLVKRLVALQ